MNGALLQGLRSPDKTRFLRAVRHVEGEEVPLLETDPDILLVNRMLEKDFPLSLHAYELPVNDYVELNRRMGNDMVYFADIWRLGRKEMTDEQGRIHYVDGIMKTPQTLSDIRFPDLGQVRRRLEQTLAAIEGSGFGLICSNKFAPSIVAVAMGIEHYWISTIESPGFVHEFQKLLREHCLRELELFASYRVEAINIGLNIGMKSGPMCSRESREAFQYPMLREQIALAHDNGIVVRLHVDGNIAGMIEEFIEMGADLLHPLEPCDGAQDIYALKERFGDRISLHGNIDVTGVLARGTPEDVRLDAIEHMERLARGGGYVVGSSHNLHCDIPLENYYALRDAVHSYRFQGN